METNTFKFIFADSTASTFQQFTDMRLQSRSGPALLNLQSSTIPSSTSTSITSTQIGKVQGDASEKQSNY
ncbi:unnamed protein product [Meloidogyne enterolobii]|uniref:Uncharacterized protein n=1 Tax=Meloidogyne enterolobii TaxID=390850 RepID=A0ACB1ARR8_MELEN